MLPRPILLAPALALLGSVLACASPVAAADPVSPAAPAPRLRVAQPEVDLGSHFAGPAFWFTFRLRNEGGALLEIRDVKLSCGCLSAHYGRTLPPGGETLLRVKMATTGVEGQVLKTIQVLSNDPATPTTSLTAKVLLKAPIQVSPGRVFQLERKPGEEGAGEITLRSQDGTPLEIRQVESSDPALRAEAVPAGGDPLTRMVRVRVAADVDKMFLANVVIHTNSRRQPRVEVQVQGFPRGAIHALPQRIYFGNLPERVPAPVTRLMMLMREDEPFTVTEARSDHPALTVEVVNKKDEPFAEVTVKYHGGCKPGRIEGKLTFLTSDRRVPSVEVPYLADVQPVAAAAGAAVLPAAAEGISR